MLALALLDSSWLLFKADVKNVGKRVTRNTTLALRKMLNLLHHQRNVN